MMRISVQQVGHVFTEYITAVIHKIGIGSFSASFRLNEHSMVGI